MGTAYEPVPRHDVHSGLVREGETPQRRVTGHPELATPGNVLWLQRMAGNQATGAALHVQRSPEDDSKAEQQLKEAQQRVYKLLAPETVWDRARTGPTLIPNDNAARDPDTVFANSSEWIRKGLGSLCVVAPVPGARPGQYFDGTVIYPNVGAQVANTVTLPGDAAGYTDHKLRRIYIFMRPGAEPDNAQVRGFVIHEVQHLADIEPPADAKADEAARVAADTSGRTDQEKHEQAIRDRIAWASYQSEFRAYWLQSLQRPPQMKDGTWLDWGPDGEFGSEMASGRDVTPRANSWDGKVSVNEGAVADWTKALDDTDIAFLRDPTASRPFWDQAKATLRQALYDWMSGYIRQGKKDASPP